MQTTFLQLTILYIEDDDIIRRNALIYLQKRCKKVWGAKDGLEALELYASFKPDIIISDIKMPHLNGLDMVTKIRKNDKKTPIILATAFTDKAYLLKAVELQLIKYLVKPITSVKLLEALNLAYMHINQDRINIIHLDKNSTYDTLNKILIINNTIVRLTRNELLLLDILAKNSKRVVSYKEIENYIWLDNEMSIETLRSLVRLLRNKLQGILIKNISGTGYKLQN